MELVSTIVKKRRSFPGQEGWAGCHWAAYSRLHQLKLPNSTTKSLDKTGATPTSTRRALGGEGSPFDGKDIKSQAPSDAVQAPSAAKCREGQTKPRPTNEMMKGKVTVEGKFIQDS
ncbi:hypothetical protein GLAREA_11805 [Glarea lozoyensis ATCC 20868]|uniref:Uncharacterized protein n=1 Tax=Glarea lozoyensis (strain ATCC 20868 / MF5171) TaxID=1116229 RepID=S3CJ16_GLAL2|nr:uncharacterized protein GLAREA_11805 [Glarea lozoyensis ATCC 20868]EPE25224.1 hypothetical protein GLAREA_11805 [Glarea lozoyensis ATCC 20868]